METRKGRGILIDSRGEVGIEEFDIPVPAADEVLVRTVSSLISAGTELGAQEAGRRCFRPGYSNAGRVVATGENVDGFSEGDRVVSLTPHASHVTVAARPDRVLGIPDGISFDRATFAVLGSVSMHGVRKAGPQLGEFAAITGMGIVGQLALQLASLTGCEAILISDPCPFRLSVSGLGPDRTFSQASDLKEKVDRLTGGRGLDLVIEASGYPQAVRSSLELLRVGGRVILLGTPWHRTVELDLTPVNLKELEIIGCHQPKTPTVESPYYPWTQQGNRRKLLQMISDGRLEVEKLITHKMAYTEISEAYRLLSQEKDSTMGVILDWS